MPQQGPEPARPLFLLRIATKGFLIIMARQVPWKESVTKKSQERMLARRSSIESETIFSPSSGAV